MSTPIPEEAVQAAARELCIIARCGPRWCCDVHDRALRASQSGYCETGAEVARAVLEAAAPIIAAQATDAIIASRRALVERWDRRIEQFEAECTDAGTCQLAVGLRTARDDVAAILDGAE